jgi:protein-histidine pros-kinase
MIVNIENLKVHFDGDDELILELLDVFESTYPKTLASLENAIHEKNYSDLELHAHTLKGMIANFFAPELKEAAFILEKSGRESAEIDFNPSLTQLKSQLPDLIQEVRSNFK